MRLKRSLALGAVGAALLAMTIPFSSPAGATTPPFEPDANSQGSIAFYNASGALVTHGTSLSHMFDYAVASSAGRVGTTKATLSFAFPDHTKHDSSTWFQASASASTNYPNTSAPAPINAFTTPVVTLGSTDGNLLGQLGTATLDTTSGYAGIIQIRVKDSGPGKPILSTPFWSTDVMFDQTANTWTQVFPAPASTPTATNTALAVSPASPQLSGTPVTLTATITPSAAGTVQFKDGTANIGSPVAVASGTATTSTSSLAAGPHTLTAAFTPTDPTAFVASVSGGTPYTITSPATPTSTTLGITPASPIVQGTQSTLTATISPTGTPGTVQFVDGATNLGPAVTVASDKATMMTTFSVNTHAVQAKFTPTDTNAFAPSQSSVTNYVVNAASAKNTTTGLAISPGSPQAFGTPLTLNAAVAVTGGGTPAGTVDFLDGSNMIGSAVTVAAGTASMTTSTLPAGGHSITARFVPTDPAAFNGSTSSVTTFTVSAASTSTVLTVTPTVTVQQGNLVTLTAAITPSTAAGAVQFMDGTANLGPQVNVSGGSATLTTTTLSVGSHTSLTAQFFPSSGNYTTSTSSPVGLQVTKAPAQDTQTSLAVSPSNNVATVGASETLTASVTPAAAGGTVQFLDGTTPLGAAVTVTGGSAVTTTTLPLGAHSLTASFVSGDLTSFKNSASAPIPFLVKPLPATTTTTLVVAPTGPVVYGTPVAMTASVHVGDVAGGVGSVSFVDGSTLLANEPVVSGTATLTTVGLVGGAHTLKATFVPTSTMDFTTSTSAPVALTVTAVKTTTALAVSPAGPVAHAAMVTLSATVTPGNIAGSVTFRNGSTVIGTVAVSGGKATLKTTNLPAGIASLTASFTANSILNYTRSTSAAVTLSVRGVPVINTITSGGSPIPVDASLHAGQVLTVGASGFSPGEAVTVVVHSAAITLGTTHASSTGTVTVTFALPATLASGSHTLTLEGASGQANFAFVVGTAAASDPPGGGVLANTGVDIAGGTGLGLALLITGAMALGLLGPRRRHRGFHRFT